MQATKCLSNVVSVPTFVLHFMFLFAATKLLIAPVVLLLVVAVGALALVIGNYAQEHTGTFIRLKLHS